MLHPGAPDRGLQLAIDTANYAPKRRRSARHDSSVGTIERDMERVYKLPKGSVHIQNPNGRNARSDKRIGRLRADYASKG